MCAPATPPGHGPGYDPSCSPMNQAPLLLIVDDARPADEAAARVSRVLDRLDASSRPGLSVVSAAGVLAQPQQLAQVAAVWIDAGREAPPWLGELLNVVADAQVPAMLTRPLHGQAAPGALADDGIVLAGTETEPAHLATTLGVLLSQSPVMHAMRSEIKLLRAHQGGLADEMGRIDEELRLAAQLQREFLPTQMPRIDGVNFDVLWRPASYVSGDIYDVTRLDESHIGFFLADAVGHGVPAALMTMFIKRSLDFKKIDPDAPHGYRIVEPGDALAQLNRDMIASQHGNVRFATACCGVIDCASNTVQIARAGHPFPMVLRADGTREMIEADGGLLGVFDGEAFEQTQVTLGVGDRLLVYSDGFEMAFPDTEADQACVANTRYQSEFLDLRHGSAAEAIERLGGRLDQQAGSLNQRDDLTIVCLAIDPPAEPQAATTAIHTAAA